MALDPMALGEQILELLDEGAVSTTYKYALLLALVELCLERGASPSECPVQLNTREVAEKVVELYWAHTRSYETKVLKQSGSGQAEVLKSISERRSYGTGDPNQSPNQFRRNNPESWARLISEVEWKLIEMPLPRLQTIGNRNDSFLYKISWGQQVSHRDVLDYQRGKTNAFDGKINLLPGVAEGFVRLSPLLRPMIRRQWTLLVAKFNRLEVTRLENFLFGESRSSLVSTREFLAEEQMGKCFLCQERLGSRCDVDHFIPWSRYANNALENLVLAHTTCNNNKRDFLASLDHVRNWKERMRPGSRHLEAMRAFAENERWDHWPERTLRVASAIYSKLPEKYSLWKAIDEFVPFTRGEFDPLFSPCN